jgi:ArpU family phage transcriptional regulator
VQVKRVTNLYSSIDRDGTAENAEMELMQWPHYWRMSRAQSYSLQSPKFDDMPKAPAVGNRTEDNIVDTLDAQKWVSVVKAIIEDMKQTNDRYSKILRLRYITGLDNDVVQERIGVGKSQYFEDKKDALVAFAEMFPPHPNRLVVRR